MAFEAELVLQGQMTASTRCRSQFGNGLGCFSSLPGEADFMEEFELGGSTQEQQSKASQPTLT